MDNEARLPFHGVQSSWVETFVIYEFQISAQLNCSIDPSAAVFKTSVDYGSQTLVDFMFSKLIL